jgi:heptose-I-phosphate ethanolaminephosphotransferase
MKNKAFKLYLLPLFIILSIPMLIYCSKHDDSRYLLAAIITILSPLVLQHALNIKPFYYILISLPVLIISIMFDALVLDYDSHVNIGAWTAVFDTQMSESKEFMTESRLVTKMIAVFQILVFLFYLIYSFRKPRINIPKRYQIAFIILLVFLLADFTFKGASRISFPLRGLENLKEYIDQKIYESKFLHEKEKMVVLAKQDSLFNTDDNQIFLVIVGESLRRDHLEYYGYKKPTTPKMLKEDLIIYNDVVSPANQTVNSLKRVFSGAEYKNDTAYYKKPTFIKAFRKSNFRSYWLSTQKIYGKHASEVSYIAKECDTIIFRNNYNHDDVLLEHLKDILKEGANKKLIFINVLGNHFTYKRRYPELFDKFSQLKYDDEKIKLIDQYDNSVLYNDYFIHETLKRLKKEKGDNIFIMFSDHGESLFDSGENLKGHGSVVPAKSEFNVPFIVWFSDSYKKNHQNVYLNVKNNKDKPIILSDFYHAAPSLFGISFPELDPTKNFFNDTYVPVKNRKVMNSSMELLYYNKLKNVYTDAD